MIATVDIQLNAAHPELPLAEFSAFVNSPSQVRVTGVPSAIGNWRLTKLYASVAYPDNTLHTVELSPGGVALNSQPQSTGGTGGGSGASPQLQNSPVSPALCGQNTPLTATLPGSAAVGSNPKGFQILADGVDESGNIVTGYCLGVGPLTIMPRDGVIVVGDTRYYFHFLDTVPATPRTGDTCVIDGVLKWYNGTDWQPFGGAQVVAPSTDPDDAGKAADAKATGDALAGKASKSDLDPLILAQYYPDGSVKSAAEFTADIKYDAPDTTNRTITVKPFCSTGDSDNDNSGLVGRVVIPPFVDEDGNGYISDDGTRYKVVGVSNGSIDSTNENLTAIVVPSTVTAIGGAAFFSCLALASISLPAATNIGEGAFYNCVALTSVSLPAATNIGNYAFNSCTALASVSLPAATSIENEVFVGCMSLTSVDFGDTPRSSVPSLGSDAFYDVPATCKIIVPDSLYDAWTAASGWSTLTQEFLRHSEWEYARRYELAAKQDALSAAQLANIAAVPNKAIASKCKYEFNTATVTLSTTTDTNDTAVVTGIVDHAKNAATLVSTVTAATITIPARTDGYTGDLFLSLTLEGSAPSITFTDAATSADLDIIFGEAQLADIDTGRNLILFSEVESGKWKVAVEHEDFAS